MSWAARRKFLYISGIVLVFLIVVVLPIAYKLATVPATCHDGIMNQGETAPDRGGPCLLLDDRYLQPHAVLWARAFQVRDGSYDAVAYIENPNPAAGVAAANYTFSLYDSDNVLIAENKGTTYIMPGGVTPVFVSSIDTGHRMVAHTYFVLTDPSLSWERMSNPTSVITISSKEVSNVTVEPQLSAIAANASVVDMRDVGFVGVLFDTAANAVDASATYLPRLNAVSRTTIGFTWPLPLNTVVGTEDVIPTMPPIPDPAGQR